MSHRTGREWLGASVLLDGWRVRWRDGSTASSFESDGIGGMQGAFGEVGGVRDGLVRVFIVKDLKAWKGGKGFWRPSCR